MSLAKHLKIKATSWIALLWKTQPARLAGHRPVASSTFDDFPKNAWVQGGPVLARYGVRATYYTAGGFCGRTEDGTVFYDEGDLQALAAAGHEIACHSFAHQPTPSQHTQEQKAEAERKQKNQKPNQKGEALVSYAYPYGKASLRT